MDQPGGLGPYPFHGQFTTSTSYINSRPGIHLGLEWVEKVGHANGPIRSAYLRKFWSGQPEDYDTRMAMQASELMEDLLLDPDVSWSNAFLRNVTWGGSIGTATNTNTISATFAIATSPALVLTLDPLIVGDPECLSVPLSTSSRLKPYWIFVLQKEATGTGNDGKFEDMFEFIVNDQGLNELWYIGGATVGTYIWNINWCDQAGNCSANGSTGTVMTLTGI